MGFTGLPPRRATCRWSVVGLSRRCCTLQSSSSRKAGPTSPQALAPSPLPSCRPADLEAFLLPRSRHVTAPLPVLRRHVALMGFPVLKPCACRSPPRHPRAPPLPEPPRASSAARRPSFRADGCELLDPSRPVARSRPRRQLVRQALASASSPRPRAWRPGPAWWLGHRTSSGSLSRSASGGGSPCHPTARRLAEASHLALPRLPTSGDRHRPKAAVRRACPIRGREGTAAGSPQPRGPRRDTGVQRAPPRASPFVMPSSAPEPRPGPRRPHRVRGTPRTRARPRRPAGERDRPRRSRSLTAAVARITTHPAPLDPPRRDPRSDARTPSRASDLAPPGRSRHVEAGRTSPARPPRRTLRAASILEDLPTGARANPRVDFRPSPPPAAPSTRTPEGARARRAPRQPCLLRCGCSGCRHVVRCRAPGLVCIALGTRLHIEPLRRVRRPRHRGGVAAVRAACPGPRREPPPPGLPDEAPPPRPASGWWCPPSVLLRLVPAVSAPKRRAMPAGGGRAPG